MSIQSPSTDHSHLDKSRLLKYIAQRVFLVAWPLAIFFATFSLFPLGMKNPLEHPNPMGYMVVWTVIGVVLGLSRWRRSKASN